MLIWLVPVVDDDQRVWRVADGGNHAALRRAADQSVSERHLGDRCIGAQAMERNVVGCTHVRSVTELWILLHVRMVLCRGAESESALPE